MTFDEFCMGELSSPRAKRKSAIISALAAALGETLREVPDGITKPRLARILAADAYATLDREGVLSLKPDGEK